MLMKYLVITPNSFVGSYSATGMYNITTSAGLFFETQTSSVKSSWHHWHSDTELDGWLDVDGFDHCYPFLMCLLSRLIKAIQI